MSKLPIIGWILDAIVALSLSIPFWYAWTFCGIGAKFFPMLPPVYTTARLMEIAGLFLCLGILKLFSPFNVSSSSSSEAKNKEQIDK